MNDTLRVIRDRYSCRDFDERPVGGELLKMIAEAGIQSPSGSNTQKWHIVMVSDRALISEIEGAGLAVIKALPDQAIYDRLNARGGTIFYHAPVFIVVAIDATGDSLPLMDCGICVENMTLAASSLGLASCICGLAGFAFREKDAEKFKAKLKFPPGYELGMTILVGYEKAPGRPHTPNPDKITYIP